MAFDMTNTGGGVAKMRPVSGYTCRRRVEMVIKDNIIMRDCGRCPGCLAKRKADRAGRGAAQVAVSQQVAWVTLTYADYTPEGREGARRFVPKHRSDLLKRLRMAEWHAARKRLGITRKAAAAGKGSDAHARISQEVANIVFTGVGETGTRGTKRRHWHLLLFFDRPSQLVASAKNASGHAMAEDRDWWPHGKVSVELIDPTIEPSAAFRRVRYVLKYVEKNRGVDPALRKQGLQDCCFFGSQGKAYGASFMEQEARRTAQAGLPYHGRYIVPGLGFSRGGGEAGRDRDGRKKIVGAFVRTGNPALDAAIRGQYQAAQKPQDRWNTVQGACRKYAIAAYKAEWQRLRPGVPIPVTEFLYRNDPDFVASDYRQSKGLPFVWAEHAKVLPKPIGPARDPARCGLLLVTDGRAEFGTVQVYDTGVARFRPKDRRFHAWCLHHPGVADMADPVWLPAGDLSVELPFLGQLDRQAVERWLVERRGADWLEPYQRRLAIDARLDEQEAAIRRFAKRSPRSSDKQATGAEPVTGLLAQLARHGGGYRGAVHVHGTAPRHQRSTLGVVRGWMGQAP